MRRCSSKDIVLWAILVRQKWLRRNSIVFGRAFTPPNQLVREARGLTLHGHTDPLVVEAWAALYAVLLAKDLGLLDIILEGDALQEVNEINLAIHSLSRIGHFTDDIRSELYCDILHRLGRICTYMYIPTLLDTCNTF
jgi:hypothetical protein